MKRSPGTRLSLSVPSKGLIQGLDEGVDREEAALEDDAEVLALSDRVKLSQLLWIERECDPDVVGAGQRSTPGRRSGCRMETRGGPHAPRSASSPDRR